MKNIKRLILSLLVLTLAAAFLPASALAATANIPVSHAIEVVKKLEGDTPPTKEVFSFKLEAKEGAPMPDSDTVTITGEGTASFGEVEYTEPVDYIYTVTEESGKTANFTYDKTVYIVTVQVTTDDDGKLTATQYVEKEEGGKPADGKITFTNTYTAPKTSTGTGTGSPKTNDATNDMLLAKIIAVSGAVMLAFIIYWSKRKSKRHKDDNKGSTL